MVWQIINQILGEASINPEFCQELLAHPIQAIDAHHFELTVQEREVLATIHAQSLAEFSQLLLAHLPPDDE